ncbi:hypothetical protein [Streptomyces sp. RKND-216]|uniref:hypothetical protein n=1 Tax=Streptomyces sp. RKND-216 TaxID=2562581 RepID=UPI001FF9A337|nr:hypothetical protein [Streptomyces sp. RKND-216]
MGIQGFARVVGAVVVGGALGLGAGAAGAASSTEEPSAFILEDPRITESSGLAASRAHPGVYWTHNDSDDGPYMYAVDGGTGKTVATVTLEGVEPRDVEAVSVGPDGDVFVGDIGDNLGGGWSEVWIYRFAEPERLRDTTVTPTRYTVRYADGPRDAESLMVHPETGRVYLASKSERSAGVYAGPEELTASGVNEFARIADVDIEATDGAFSPDGSRLVLRSYFGSEMYRWTDEGRPEPVGSVPVSTFGQGESVTFTPDGLTLMFGSEGSNSRVAPQELEGEALPESAAAQREKAERSSDGAPPREGEEGEERDLVVGAIVFAAATVIWLSLRRVFGRRRD